MPHYFQIIISDFVGLTKTCGLFISVKWIIGIVLNIKICIKERNLMAADIYAGSGSFKAKRENVEIIISGIHGLGGVRELWVRDVYLKHGILKIPRNGIIVDLGANIGIFTLLALTLGCNKIL